MKKKEKFVLFYFMLKDNAYTPPPFLSQIAVFK
jgi:hypothetical protein